MSRQIKITVSDEFYAEIQSYAKASGEMRPTSLLRWALSHYMRKYPRHAPGAHIEQREPITHAHP